MELHSPEGLKALHIEFPPKEPRSPPTMQKSPPEKCPSDMNNLRDEKCASLSQLLKSIKEASVSMTRTSMVAKNFKTLQASSLHGLLVEISERSAQNREDDDESTAPLRKMLNQKQEECYKVVQYCQAVQQNSANEILLLKRENADLIQRLDLAKGQTDFLIQARDAALREHTCLSNETEQQRKQIAQLQSTQASSQKQNDQLSIQLSSALSSVAKLKAERDRYHDCLSKVMTEAAQHNVDVTQIRKDLEDMERGHERLQGETKIAQRLMQKQQHEIDQMDEEMMQLRMEHKKLEIKHHELLLENKDLQERFMHALSCRSALQEHCEKTAGRGLGRKTDDSSNHPQRPSGASRLAFLMEDDDLGTTTEDEPTERDRRGGGVRRSAMDRIGNTTRAKQVPNTKALEGDLRRRLLQARAEMGERHWQGHG